MVTVSISRLQNVKRVVGPHTTSGYAVASNFARLLTTSARARDSREDGPRTGQLDCVADGPVR